MTHYNSLYFSYPIASNVPLDDIRQYVLDKLDVVINEDELHHYNLKLSDYPEPIVCEEFNQEIKSLNIDHSELGEDRIFRSHGQNFSDIYLLRCRKFGRIPDIVLWPKNHEEVVSIVQTANKYNVVILPYGGGTSVTGAITCPQNEKRTIAALDTSQMNQLLWLDKSNLLACFQAGVVGQDLERLLNKEGLTMGHEPDSIEFSTLGGWISTRASGMKKNLYGNIEDIVVRIKIVTSKGVLERNNLAPRISAGPDLNHLVLGSEGTLGVITEAVVKVHPLPPVRKYDSIIFPDFESGFSCLREITKMNCRPASLRLVDCQHFEMGKCLKNHSGWTSVVFEKIKLFYLTTFKGFDLKNIAMATVMYEGSKETVELQQKIVNNALQRNGGITAGPSYGEDGYRFTFVVAYIRVINSISYYFQNLLFNFELLGLMY